MLHKVHNLHACVAQCAQHLEVYHAFHGLVGKHMGLRDFSHAVLLRAGNNHAGRTE